MVLFLLISAGTGIVDTVAPVELPRLIGFERVQEEKLRRDAAIGDGTKARLAEHRQRLRSRVRRWVTPEYGFALYRWLGEMRPTVICGKDGWLFIRSRAVPGRVMNDDTISLRVSQIASISRRMADLGSRLIMVPVPRKAVLCADYLPGWCRTQHHVDSTFVAALLLRGVACADLFGALKTSSAAPYYKRGSHWTDESRILAAEEICRAAGILSPDTDRTTRVVPLGEVAEEYSVLEFGGVEPNGRIKRILARTTSPGVRVAGSVARSQDGGKRPGVVLVGTSFSRDLLHLLLCHYSQVPIERHAERGTLPLDVLAGYLGTTQRSAHRADLPRVVLLELPVYQLIEGLDGGVGKLFGVLQPQSVVPLSGASCFDLAPAMRRERVLPRRPIAVGEVRRGLLAHATRGSIGVHLVGTLTGGEAIVEVNAGSGMTPVRWGEGEDSLVVPILGVRPSTTLRISVRSAGSGGRAHLSIREARLVAYGSLHDEQTARIEPLVASRTGWHQNVLLDARGAQTGCRESALLEIRLSVRGPFDGRIRMEIRSGDGPADEFTFRGLSRDARLLLDAPGSVDDAGLVVRLSGTGPAPRNLAGSARLLVLSSTREPKGSPATLDNQR